MEGGGPLEKTHDHLWLHPLAAGMAASQPSASKLPAPGAPQTPTYKPPKQAHTYTHVCVSKNPEPQTKTQTLNRKRNFETSTQHTKALRKWAFTPIALQKLKEHSGCIGPCTSRIRVSRQGRGALSQAFCPSALLACVRPVPLAAFTEHASHIGRLERVVFEHVCSSYHRMR